MYNTKFIAITNIQQNSSFHKNKFLTSANKHNVFLEQKEHMIGKNNKICNSKARYRAQIYSAWQFNVSKRV